MPSDACSAERQALRAAVASAGAADVTLLAEPVAAAIGAGADLASGFAQMVVDVGEGVTDASVVDQRGLVASAAVRVGCATLRAGGAPARGRARVDAARPSASLRTHGVGGDAVGVAARRDGATGVDAGAVHAALAASTAAIAACVAGLLRGLDDRAACQVIDGGIVLTGGGALLPGLRAVIEDATQVATRVADDPLNAVIRGASAVLREAARVGAWPMSDDVRATRSGP
ncbi:MAG: rod shape-determining protein [bacterium]|nr:rod shape-determining protein [bacterium]